LHVNCTDCDDILNRRNSLVGQLNDTLCYFGKLNPLTKINLMYSYCSSLYGCELWDPRSQQLSTIAVSWRKALRRLWNLPYDTHSHVLYALCDKLPIEDEVCRRSLRFAMSCISTDCSVVRDVVKMNLLHRPAQSVIGRNLLNCCELYNLQLFDSIKLSVSSVKSFTNKVNFMKLCNIKKSSPAISQEHLNLLVDCISVRDGVFKLVPETDSMQDIICDIILYICTA